MTPTHPRNAWWRILTHPAIRRTVLAVALAAVILAVVRRPEQPLPTYWEVSPFTLTDQGQQPFRSDALAGRAVVVSFVYTNCPDTCPLLTATLANAQDQLRRDGLLGSRVQLLSITVDPDRDTPDVLAAYAARFRADPDAWHFLTGERDVVFGVLEDFRVNTRPIAQANAGKAVVPHSNRIAIVDPAGQVRALLRGEEVPPDEIVRTVKRTLSTEGLWW